MCPNIPLALKDKFVTCINIVPLRMSALELWGTGGLPITPGPSCLSQSAQNNLVGASTPLIDVPALEPLESTSEHRRIASNQLRPSTLWQQHMSGAYHTTKRKELDEKWANFFYQANVAFNVVSHPSFTAAVHATSLARFNYEPPSYHAMRTTLTEPTKKHVEVEIRRPQSSLLRSMVPQFVRTIGTTLHVDH